MRTLSILCILFTLSSVVAQKTITVINKLPTAKSFTYRFIKQEYITNENNFFLDVYNDTNFLKFNQLQPSIYGMKIYRDEACTIPYNGIDTTKKMRYVWKFDDSGNIKTLLNYADFARLLVAAEEVKLKNKSISEDELVAAKGIYSNPMLVAGIINPDFLQMFRIAGDTFNEANIYLSIRNITSPINQSIIPIMGNTQIKVISEEASIYGIHAKNQAEGETKQLIKQQLLDYMKTQDQTRIDQRKEITRIGLNAEQDWVYNLPNQRFSKITLSDVFVINLQSRGNIRIFEYWGQEE